MNFFHANLIKSLRPANGNLNRNRGIDDLFFLSAIGWMTTAAGGGSVLPA